MITSMKIAYIYDAIYPYIKILPCLKKDISPFLSGLFGAILGGSFFLLLFDFSLLNPLNIEWLMGDQGDITQSFLGWHFFRNSEWTFPLGKILQYNFPQGTSIGFTDSIPFLALLFKTMNPLLSDSFQYLGPWLFFCYILQGFTSALLIRAHCKNVVLIILGTLFFVINPVLLNRIGHVALVGHWILLAALWFYSSLKTFQTKKYFSFWLILFFFSCGTHPYLTIMVFCLFLAHNFHLKIIDKNYLIKQLLLNHVFFIFIILILWWNFGYFSRGYGVSNYTAEGYGYFSLNLNALFNFHSSSLFKGLPYATKGQYEGFSYLGLGGIILCILSFLALISKPGLKQYLKKHSPLIAVCIILTLYALSQKSTFGDKVLINIPLPSFLGDFFSIFRSSGRFFWVPYYILLTIPFFILAERLKLSFMILILIFTLCLQVLDLKQLYQQKTFTKRWSYTLVSHEWETLAKQYEHIVLLPPRKCAHPPQIPIHDLIFFSSKNRFSLNTGLYAHPYIDSEYCNSLVQLITNHTFDSKTLYIPVPRLLRFLDLNCTKIDAILVCRKI